MASIAVTINVDWCPRSVAEWLLARLADARVRATVFATDAPRIDFGGHETAILAKAFVPGRSLPEEVRRLKGLYPEAIGLRTYRLAWESEFERPLLEMGIKYVGAPLVPMQPVAPFRVLTSLVQFPVYYLDRHELMNPQQYHPEFSLAGLSLDKPGLYVFAFNPNLLFTNAPSEAFYRERVKPHDGDEQRLEENRYRGRGCFDLFCELLALRGKSEYRFLTLREAYGEFFGVGT